ncbi:MAG: hypothetical protein M1816_002152 [Peltula sp. TS41687]|nr:MAG: hypothetical protein M1816_002152 [Peltula sp. TS41687]
MIIATKKWTQQKMAVQMPTYFPRENQQQKARLFWNKEPVRAAESSNLPQQKELRDRLIIKVTMKTTKEARRSSLLVPENKQKRQEDEPERQ